MLEARTLCRMFVWGALLASGAVLPSKARGQLEIEPEDQIYNVRVVNEMGELIHVKLIGAHPDAKFGATLNDGVSSNRYQFRSGERFLFVWDRNRNLLLLTRININGSGKLRIRPFEQEETFGAAAPVPELLKIERE